MFSRLTFVIALVPFGLTFPKSLPAADSPSGCEPPPNIQIIAADVCKTWGDFRWAFEEARKRMWFSGYLMEPLSGVSNRFPDPKIEEMGPLQLTLVNDTLVLPGFSGIFFPNEESGGPPSISVAAANPSYAYLLMHELTHWIYWKFRDRYGDDWMYVGHGEPWDPLVYSVNQAIAMFYDGLYPFQRYHPGFLPTPKNTQSGSAAEAREAEMCLIEGIPSAGAPSTRATTSTSAAATQ